MKLMKSELVGVVLRMGDGIIEVISVNHPLYDTVNEGIYTDFIRYKTDYLDDSSEDMLVSVKELGDGRVFETVYRAKDIEQWFYLKTPEEEGVSDEPEG